MTTMPQHSLKLPKRSFTLNPSTLPKMTRRTRSALLSSLYDAARTLAAWLMLAALFSLLFFVP